MNFDPVNNTLTFLKIADVSFDDAAGNDLDQNEDFLPTIIDIARALNMEIQCI